MNLSLPDSRKYIEAIHSMAHLIREWGAKEVLLDLRVFFPDQFAELEDSLLYMEKEKKIARLLDASEGGRKGSGMVHDSVVVERQDSPEGD